MSNHASRAGMAQRRSTRAAARCWVGVQIRRPGCNEPLCARCNTLQVAHFHSQLLFGFHSLHEAHLLAARGPLARKVAVGATSWVGEDEPRTSQWERSLARSRDRVSTARVPQPTVSSFAATARDGGCRLAEGRDGAARGRVPALLVSYASRGCVRARPVRFLPSCARACAWCHHVRVALLANLDVAVNRITVLRHRVRFAGVTTARGASRNGRHLARLFIVRFNMLQNLTSHSYTVSGTAVLAVS